MTNDWNTMVVAVIAASIAGTFTLAGVFITGRGNLKAITRQFSYQNKYEQRQILRARGEELYQSIASWIANIFFSNISLIAVMKGEISYNDHLDLIINSKSSNEHEFQRIEMLIDVYFPNVRQKYDEMIATRDLINKISSAHKLEYKVGNNCSNFIKPIQEALLQSENKGEELKRIISNELKNI